MGKAASAAAPAGVELSMVTVFSVVPSKLSESSTTLLKASIVVSAKDNRKSVLSHGAYVKPKRGCQLFPSDEQAEIKPLPKAGTVRARDFPPLNAPASKS